MYLSYNDYMASTDWALTREARLVMDNYTCQYCGNNKIEDLQVHHKTYENLGNEDVDNDLITVCKACHQRIHEADKDCGRMVTKQKLNEERQKYWNEKRKNNFLLVSSFVKSIKHKDIAFGGDLNLCKQELIEKEWREYTNLEENEKVSHILDVSYYFGVAKQIFVIHARQADLRKCDLKALGLSDNSINKAWDKNELDLEYVKARALEKFSNQLSINFDDVLNINQIKEKINMKKFSNYESTQAYTGAEKLPTGGYVLVIKAVKLIEGKNGNSDMLTLSFDIAEGEHKGFFANNYKNQTQEDKKWKGTYRIYCPTDDGSERDEWTKRKFKTIMAAFEESNPGYAWNWDENTLKGKTIGAIFNEKEYDFNGHQGFFTNCYGLVTTEKIRSGNFKVPEPTLLKKENKPATPITGNEDFFDLPDSEETPFA